MALSRPPIPLAIGSKFLTLLYFPMKPMAEEVGLKNFMLRGRWQGTKLFWKHRNPAASGTFSLSLDAGASSLLA
jgi:hypothetical protein